MKANWSRLGGQLGVGLCILGFLFVFLGWNGAASVDRVPSQFPYLISGGVAGLCFVVMGVGMIIVQNQRADRAALQTTLQQLQHALEQAGLVDAHATDPVADFVPPPPRPTPERVIASAEVEQATFSRPDDDGDDGRDDGDGDDEATRVTRKPARRTQVRAAKKPAKKAAKRASRAKKAAKKS